MLSASLADSSEGSLSWGPAASADSGFRRRFNSWAISFKSAWRIGAVLELVHRLTRNLNEPRMSRFLAAQLATSHYFDIQRARDDFGYSPQVSTEEGMKRLASDIQRTSG